MRWIALFSMLFTLLHAQDEVLQSADSVCEEAALVTPVFRGLKNKVYRNLAVCNWLRTRNLRVTGNAIMENLTAQNITTQNLTAQDITAQNITTQNLTTQTLTAQNLQVTDISLLGTINNQPYKVLYVDKNSTAPGTPNGSFYNPYLTIQSAINRIATNGDNAVNSYRIEVAPGTYTENLTFNNALLYSIALFGHSQVTIAGTISSTSSNSQLTDVNFNGFTVTGAITYTSGAQFFTGNIGAQFQNSAINGAITATNVATLSIIDSLSTGNITATNVPELFFFGGDGQVGGNLTLVNSTAFYDSTSFEQGVVTLDASSILHVQGSMFTDSASSINNSGRIDAYASYLEATSITNNGGAFINLFGSFFPNGVISGAGTLVTKTPAQLIDYHPTTPSNWGSMVPTHVAQALDLIAANLNPVTP